MWDTRVLGGIVILGVAVAMVVVGALNLEACENDGALYLVVNGSFLLGFPFLAGIIFICLPPFYIVLGFFGITISNLAIQIWGSITVLGELQYWIHKWYD